MTRYVTQSCVVMLYCCSFYCPTRCTSIVPFQVKKIPRQCNCRPRCRTQVVLLLHSFLKINETVLSSCHVVLFIAQHAVYPHFAPFENKMSHAKCNGKNNGRSGSYRIISDGIGCGPDFPRNCWRLFIVATRAPSSIFSFAAFPC